MVRRRSAVHDGRMVETIQDVLEAIVIASDNLYTPWTPGEDRLLLTLYKSMGPKWRAMVPHFTARTEDGLRQRHTRLQKPYDKRKVMAWTARQRKWTAYDTCALVSSVQDRDVQKFQYLVNKHFNVSGVRHKRDRLLIRNLFPGYNMESWKYLVSNVTERTSTPLQTSSTSRPGSEECLPEDPSPRD